MFIAGLEAEIQIVFWTSRKLSWSNFIVLLHWFFWCYRASVCISMGEIGPTHFSTSWKNDIYLGYYTTYEHQIFKVLNTVKNNTEYIPVNFPNITFFIVKFILGHSVQWYSFCSYPVLVRYLYVSYVFCPLHTLPLEHCSDGDDIASSYFSFVRSCYSFGLVNAVR